MTTRKRPPVQPRKSGPQGPAPATAPVLKLDRVAAKLITAVGPGCARRVEVPLTAVATGVALLGAPTLVRGVLSHLAVVEPRQAVEQTRTVWQRMQDERPFLRGHLGALLGWLTEEDPSPENVAAFQRCLRVLADLDLHAVASQPGVGGELLGPVYTLLRSAGGRKATGAFFTPMSVALAMAACGQLVEGDSFAEPCSGAGAMAVAAAREMRSRGHDPAQVRWVLNDVDPVAVALSGINAVVHGLGASVMLRCGDGLTLDARGLADETGAVVTESGADDGVKQQRRAG